MFGSLKRAYESGGKEYGWSNVVHLVRSEINYPIVNALVGFPIGRGILKWMFQHGLAWRHRFRKWTVVTAQDMNAYHSIEAEEELMKSIIEEINETRNDQFESNLILPVYGKKYSDFIYAPYDPINPLSLDSIPEIELQMSSVTVTAKSKPLSRANPRFK